MHSSFPEESPGNLAAVSSESAGDCECWMWAQKPEGKKKKPKGTGMRKGGQHCEVKEREGVRRVSLRELSEGRLGLDHREGTRG